MNELIPKSALTFPNDKMIQITYPKPQYLIVGQVADMILLLSFITFFLSTIMELITWNFFYILLSISLFAGVVRLKIPSNSLMEVILQPEVFKYNYAVKANNREKIIRKLPRYIDFKVQILPKFILIQFMDIRIKLHDLEDLPAFIDKVAQMFEMKYIDTCRLSNNQEVLMYQQKRLIKLVYPSLINIVPATHEVKFYDMKFQNFWVDFNGTTGTIKFIDYADINPNKSMLMSDVKKIEVIMQAGKVVKNNKNRIVINLIEQNDTKNTIFMTQPRKRNEELTTYRDTNRIYDELKKIAALDKVEIVKIWNIQ